MPRPTSLLVKPAGPDCNIACRYCFYSGKKELFASMPRHRISEELMEKAVREFLPLAGPQAHIGFQGGEPTLRGLDFFRRTVEWRRQYRAPLQQVQLALQTNGILVDDEWAEFLAKEQFLIGLSMDGPAFMHDTYRRGFDDSETHARVAKTMERLKKVGAEFNTLTVVTKGNVGHAKELYDYFNEEGSGYMQFIPCVEVVDGIVQDYTPTPEELGEFWCEMFDLWLGSDNRTTCYIRLFDELLISLMEFQAPGCPQRPYCAANLVLEHNGDIYPCDFFVDPEWKLGNIENEPLAEICKNPLLEKFITRKIETDPECAACKWRCFCNGDCPKYRLNRDGTPSKHSYWCESYRMLLEHAYPRLMSLKKVLMEEHPKADYWKRMYAALGRNDPCPCGSGMKLKKCCGPLKLG